MRLSAWAVTLTLISPWVSTPIYAQTESQRVERLEGLCKLWGAVKYFHPYLAYREDLDWDKALVEAIPKVSGARNDQEYAAAVQGMLGALKDPATRVAQENSASNSGARTLEQRDPQYRVTSDGVLVVTISHYDDLTDFVGTRDKFGQIKEQITKARFIVFDLRSWTHNGPEARENLAEALVENEIGQSLTAVAVTGPGERRRMHIGFPPQTGYTGGGYKSTFYVSDGKRFQPAAQPAAAPVVFLVNAESTVPSIALALQSAGRGSVIAEGSVSDESTIGAQSMTLPGGLAVQFRIGELVYPDGTGGFVPDDTVPSSPLRGDQNPTFQAALELARHFKPPAPHRRPLPSRAAPLPEKAYPEMKYPSAAYRLMAAFRLWTAIHYFYPYKDLMGDDWDAVLAAFIPRMEKAKNALEYALALAEMSTHIHDSHVFVNGPAFMEYLGTTAPPLEVRMIEGLPVVTQFADEAAAKGAGLEVGDIVLKVDGEDANSRMARLSIYLAASTPQSLGLKAANLMMRGPENSVAALTVRNRNNQVKEVKMARSLTYVLDPCMGKRPGDIVRVLPGNLGYVDLGRLPASGVDEMFEKLQNTKAIIFDMRDYPLGTAWPIAPRLTEKANVAAALFQRPVVMATDPGDSDISSPAMVQSFVQNLPAANGRRYAGRTVMLIDERTISQAENTGLFFEAANGTKFIGGPTMGANGDVTYVVVPGGISISFTGLSVRHADGRQLQRVGLKPDVAVSPTIAGLRAGRDEVLEKAIAYLSQPEK